MSKSAGAVRIPERDKLCRTRRLSYHHAEVVRDAVRAVDVTANAVAFADANTSNRRVTVSRIAEVTRRDVSPAISRRLRTTNGDADVTVRTIVVMRDRRTAE